MVRDSVKRRMVDEVTRRLVGFGGASVLATIALILLCLLWVVVPIFADPELEALPPVPSPEVGVVAFGASPRPGAMYFLSKESGLVFSEHESGALQNTVVLEGAGLIDARLVYPTQDTYALLDEKGVLRFLRIGFHLGSDAEQPQVEALGESLFNASEWYLGDARDFDVYREGDRMRLASLVAGGTIQVVEFVNVDNAYELTPHRSVSLSKDMRASRVRFGPAGRWIFAFSSDGELNLFEASKLASAKNVFSGRLLPEGERVLALEPLLGRYSWLLAHGPGRVTQWSLAPAERGAAMHALREFAFDAPIRHLRAEPHRKGFVAIDAQGGVHLAHTSSGRLRTTGDTILRGVRQIAVSPRADRLYALLGSGEIHRYALHNAHPEISWSAMWRKVWFEGDPEPSHAWDSSTTEPHFEPKFSLAPLLFGTLKAAFFAMLIAAPLAVLGAIYIAYFMNPRMRLWIKPGIEMMAALPTVVLGFLAGLWLAPFVESHLTATLLAFPLLLLAVLFLSFLWHRVSARFPRDLDGWLGALCVPVAVLLVWILFSNDAWFEAVIFGGSAQDWFREELGLAYEERNALIVGVAMGFAVIPIIFSISEDAIHGVPRHLVSGSLALGATPWQTLRRVVILTASPGIVAALVIGFSRAIGETMIVLMAAGNTPILDLNLFEGMRTFAANIAIELPGSERGTSHYSVLFLTALMLFAITLVFNTLAEVMRSRLRKRFAQL